MVSRMQYIAYFVNNGDSVRGILRNSNIDIAFFCPKKGYLVFYHDNNALPFLIGILRRAKGFKHVETSKGFDENLNF